MSIFHQFGPTTIAKIKNSRELRRLFTDPWLHAEIVIIKPNWVQNFPATFTDCETLRMLLNALDSKVTVIEGHQIHRVMKGDEEGPSFTVEGKERNWKWLKTGGWSWMEKHSDWSWFREGDHWSYIREMEQRFLDELGFTDLFQEFDVDYVNVTEEIWNNRVVDAKVVKKAVEQKYPPVFLERMYGFMPRKLYDLSGSTLISFNKLKQYATFTFKNMFGLIPDPIRAWWHGPKNKRMNDSLIGINLIYESLFNIYGIVEALKTTAITSKEGKFKLPGFKFNIFENLGFIAFGRNRVELDTIMCELGGFPRKDVSYLDLAEEIYGHCNLKHIESAKKTVSDWLPKKDG